MYSLKAVEQKSFSQIYTLQHDLHLLDVTMGQYIELVLSWKNTLSDQTIQESHSELFQSVYRSKVQLLLFLSAVFIYLFFTVMDFLYLYRMTCFCTAFNPGKDYSVAFVHSSKWEMEKFWTLTWLDKRVLDEV